MVGMKQFCALLLAGGMGATSVVAVQKAKPAITKARAAPQKPKVQKAVQQRTEAAQITECPSVALVGPGIDSLVPLQTADSIFAQRIGGQGFGGSGNGGGGGGFRPGVRPDPLPIVPGVPQPDTWVMLVAGFGFLGLAVRRRPRVARARQGQ